MTDTENKALYIAEQCRAAGLTMAGAAGVLANVEAESAFRSDNLQDCYQSRLGMDDATYTQRVDNGTYQGFVSDAAGYGLAQWTASDRKALMLAYFRQRGKSIGDFQTQTEFLLAEMRSYGKAWGICTSSANPYECGYAVCRYYEIPADTENQARYRGKLSEKWYSWIGDVYNQTVIDLPQEKPSDEPNPQTDSPEVKSWPPRMISENINGWPEVWLLQSLLFCHGYSVPHNGIFGESLTRMVKEYQKSKGLQQDGVVGRLTWAALGIKL